MDLYSTIRYICLRPIMRNICGVGSRLSLRRMASHAGQPFVAFEYVHTEIHRRGY